MALTLNRILTIVFMVGILTSNVVAAFPISEDLDDNQNILDQRFDSLYNGDFLINSLERRRHHDYYYSEDYFISDLEEEQVTPVKGTSPIFKELRIENPQRVSSSESDIKKIYHDPDDYTEFYRGETIDISGELTDSVTDWDNEFVEIYYNITQAQFLSDIATYRASSYRIADVLTDFQGNFSYSLVTSDLSIDVTSVVGNITIFTWFNGDYGQGRWPGSPGGSVVTVYGQVEINILPTIGNRDSYYSFLVEINFENGTRATTSGTSFYIYVNWTDASEIHLDGVETFTASNTFLHSSTSPLTVSNVTCKVTYDITNLPFYNFKVYGDTTKQETILTDTVEGETYDRIEVQAYYQIGVSHVDARIDIALDSFITLYANVSNSTHIMGAGYTVRIRFYNASMMYNLTDVFTNSTGEIELMHFVDHNNILNITDSNSFYITFSLIPAEFPAPVQGDWLFARLTVNIGSVEIKIADSTSFYTSGLDIDYGIVIRDEFGRILPYADFSISFPGLGLVTDSMEVSGIYNTTDTIPVYIIAQQTDTKTIFVDALAKSISAYAYILPAATNGTDTFNMYYSLTLELRAEYDPDIINDGENVDIWNNTYYSYFSPGSYNLTVTDQSGRNPIGAPFNITFEGKNISGIVTSLNNIIFLNLDFDVFGNYTEAGVDLSQAGAYVLKAMAGEGVYALTNNTIIQNINIYGPDNDAPSITFVGLSPDPYDPGIHVPYYNITVTVAASDVGTGIRYVELNYRILEEDNSTVAVGWTSSQMNFIGGGIYEIIINTTVAQSQYFVQYYVVVKDFAGHGLDDLGAKQTLPIYYYDIGFGLVDMAYNRSMPDFYQVGDVEAPIEEAAPDIVGSVNPLNPYLNITLYIDDTLVDSGMTGVYLVVYIYDNATGILINENGDPLILAMTNIGGNEWYYQMPGIYNYDIVWFYVARDAATPIPNDLYGPQMVYSVVEFNPPTIGNLVVDYNGTIALHDTLIVFNVTVTDAITGVGNVTVFIRYNGVDYTVNMTQVGTTSLYTGSFNLASVIPDDYGTYPLEYYVFAEDAVGNNVTTTVNSISVLYQNPRGGPGGFTGSWGAIIGASAGGIVAIIAVLFLWINRHTIQTFAKKQTFRRRLRDYLREIIEDIKKDGLEGRYKEGLLKTWRVVEGIGREFYNLPRYRSQTPMEFSRLLAQKGKIERELLYTLLEYFTKARYGYEEITEKDFNSGVRALLKIVDKIEVGEMQIES